MKIFEPGIVSSPGVARCNGRTAAYQKVADAVFDFELAGWNRRAAIAL
jgi:hypothetical protein